MEIGTSVWSTTLDSTDNLSVRLTSDLIDGKKLDTKVEILETGTLCWVCGEDRQKFIDELNAVIAKYRI